MIKIKGWRQDRDEKNRLTFWGTGYGLRRGYIYMEKINGIWLVQTYKNQGYSEPAKKLPDKKFKYKKDALAYAKKHMRANPNG